MALKGIKTSKRVSKTQDSNVSRLERFQYHEISGHGRVTRVFAIWSLREDIWGSYSMQLFSLSARRIFLKLAKAFWGKSYGMLGYDWGRRWIRDSNKISVEIEWMNECNIQVLKDSVNYMSFLTHLMINWNSGTDNAPGWGCFYPFSSHNQSTKVNSMVYLIWTSDIFPLLCGLFILCYQHWRS